MLDLIYSFCIHCEFLLFINCDRFLLVISFYRMEHKDLISWSLKCIPEGPLIRSLIRIYRGR
jgi:hypothetical protein